MAASLHLARYSPHQAARMLGAMWRHRAAFEATPGLAAARLCFTAELDTITGGFPRLTQWGLLCAWETGDARDEFFGDGRRLRPFLAGAREWWGVSLEAVRVVLGDGWHGWRPSTHGVAPLAADEPVVVMTYAVLRKRYLPTFTWNNRTVVRELAPNPSHVMRVGLADHPLARATISVWRSQEAVARFAYGPGTHDPIQRHSREVPWGTEYFFARFRPLAAMGTWDGCEPVAVAAGHSR
jgi:hypothetical protein